MLKFWKKLSVDVNAPSRVGVVLPRNTTGAFAQATGEPPADPGSQNTAVASPLVGSIVASTTRLPHHAPTGYPTACLMLADGLMNDAPPRSRTFVWFVDVLNVRSHVVRAVANAVARNMISSPCFDSLPAFTSCVPG